MNEDKIQTSLPYQEKDIPLIIERGAIVNMANVFPEEKDTTSKIKKSFIFLRNTGFNNVALDFSNCTKENKFSFLKEYITTDLSIDNKSLSDTLIQVLCRMWLIDTEIKGFLTDEEITSFISQHKELLSELTCLINSLTIFYLYQSEITQDMLDFSTIKKQEETRIGINFMHLLGYDEIMILACMGDETKFFTKYFKKENVELARAIVEGKLQVDTLMYGLATSLQSDWKNFMEKLSYVQ